VRSKDKNLFRDNYLRFQLRKPAAWRFLPPAWSPVAQMKNATEDATDWIRFAKLPFCCAMDHHESPEHAYSTLQVTARPFAIPSNQTAADILNAQIEYLSQQFLDFEAIQATSEAIVAGYRANLIRSSFVLVTERGEEVAEISVLSRSWMIFAPGWAFTLGLSSSADEDFYNETDFDDIIASVRIGT